MVKKKQKKSKGEKVAENYFPVDETDLKHTIEKKEKKPERKDLETIEKVKKKTTKRKTTTKKTKRKTSKKKPKVINRKNFSHPKVKLKSEGYELIITEKPQAALKISSALGKSTKKDLKKIPYYEVDRDGKKIVVTCAVGHLFTLKQKEKVSSDKPIFNLEWYPNYLVRKKDFTKRYYDTILKLVKGAESVTVATDYDIEGEVIGLNVVRFLCGQKDASRMKFSTLTNQELNNAYDNKSPSLDWGQAIAGETRHYLDWFYGINLSRSLMNAIKTTGKFRIMSVGRVQGPALELISEKEKEIQKFEPQKYWNIYATIKNKHELELKHNKDIFNEKELTEFENIVGQKVEAKLKKTTNILPPNPPFNLTNLQTQAYSLHGITPIKTIQAAQSLYLAGLISYPRTSSQKLPESIDYKTILKKIAKEYSVEHLIKKKKPIEGKGTDPAHPSIYPTGEFKKLSGDEEKIYSLIVKRFLALFCEDAEIENKTISVDVDKKKFSTRGSSIKKKAWMEIYPYKLKELEVPDIEGPVKIISSRTEEKETKPPNRYSPASILTQLEKRNLGTKATRASILETLYNRNYIKEKSIEMTPLGISLISTLKKYSPIIIDQKLTRNFEKGMEEIRQSKGKEILLEKEQKVLETAKKTIIGITSEFRENEIKIGKKLLAANTELIEQQREENKLNICPKCKKGNLGITYSKINRRYFVACNAYPNCKNTFTLPPNGQIKKTEKICEECGFPMLIRLSKGKRPWTFCFNPECPTNKERIEEYRKKQEEELKNNPETKPEVKKIKKKKKE
ncbi:DNA topoisomerase I [Candidatus Pacearchaeota archaeon]|nr:DNA topoisomerase I [Candidatus Pacearchaeota archaeon]